jgi:hypothetical protein
MRWRRRVLALPVALTLSGCPQPEPTPEPIPEPTPNPSFSLELGQGEQFTPISEGDPLLMLHGFQGIQHIPVSLRAWNLSPLSATVDLSLVLEDSGERLSQPSHVRLSFSPGNTPDDPAELDGLLLVIPDSPPVGQTVRLTASVQSASGEVVNDSRTGPLQWAPDSP